MSMFGKIFLHRLPIHRPGLAVPEFLERVGDGVIIVQHVVASIALGLLCPGYEAIPVTALAHLALADVVVCGDAGHRRVVGQAHQVLAQDHEAVVEV